MPCRVLIAGASMAGLRMAESLRATGFDGPVTLVGDEAHPPYNRPPLSKDVLTGSLGPEQLMQTLAFRQRAAAADPPAPTTWLTGRTVARADLARRTVELADGEVLPYDVLVAATGLRPRRIGLPGAEGRRFILRKLPDALALREALVPGRRLAVIGGGFIGCEVASSARKRGLEVTVIEPMAQPMLRALGPQLASAMRELHEHEGVAFRLGAGVHAFAEAAAGAPVGIRLDDGSEIRADVVVESVGSHCNVEWLQGNGLDLSDGLLCDGRLRVQGRDDLYAAGDIARYPNAFIDDLPRRVEHWCIPTMTARRAAESLAASLAGRELPAAFHALPSFWSDQHGLRLQSVGMPALGDRTEVLEGRADPEGFRNGGAALGYYRGERLIGVASLGLPAARLAHYRELVTRAGPPAPAA